jgi:hypothetical protein
MRYTRRAATSRGRYVAVHEEQVVETGETLAEVAMRGSELILKMRK